MVISTGSSCQDVSFSGAGGVATTLSGKEVHPQLMGSMELDKELVVPHSERQARKSQACRESGLRQSGGIQGRKSRHMKVLPLDVQRGIRAKDTSIFKHRKQSCFQSNTIGKEVRSCGRIRGLGFPGQLKSSFKFPETRAYLFVLNSSGFSREATLRRRI